MSTIDSSVAPIPADSDLHYRDTAVLSDQAIEMFLKTDTARRAEIAILTEQAAKAERPLRWIAFSHSLSVIIALLVLSGPLQAGDTMAIRILAICVLMTLASWGLWLWSLKEPLPAAILGLLMFASETMLQVSLTAAPNAPNGAGTGQVFGFLDITTVVLLIRAIMNGSRQRRVMQQATLIDDPLDKTPKSIASGIFLYMALLVVILILRGLAMQVDYKFTDSFNIQILMAAVVIVWAAAAWRDTLPAILKIPPAKWFGIALLVPMATSLFASVWLDILRMLMGVKPTNIAEPFFQNGYGWLTLIGLTAVYPATFEELAFRGVIVPCLRRALSDGETIAVTGIMFMILHLSPFSAPHLLALGLALGYVRLKCGSIWPCVLMHFAHNALCIGIDQWFR